MDVRELATGRFIAQTDNVLVFGPPGVGKTHLAIALGRAAVEAVGIDESNVDQIQWSVLEPRDQTVGVA